MGIVVLLILAGIWAAVLITPIVRARAESSPADSIGDFRRQLRVLQRTGPSRGLGIDVADGGRYVEAVGAVPLGPLGTSRRGNVAAPVAGARSAPIAAQGPAVAPTASARRARTIRRRRDVMFTLLMGMGTTFVLAMVVSSTPLWMLHFVMDALFLGFVAMLVRVRNIAAEKEMKLRLLPQPAVRPQPVPAFAMRRSATN